MTRITYRSTSVVLQAHERIHSGAGWSASSVAADVPRKSAHNILMHCGDKPVHLYSFACRSDAGDSIIELRESPGVVSEGVPLIAEPNHRLKSIDTLARLTEFAEIGANDGKRLTVTPSYKQSGAFPGEPEWILAENTIYLIRCINPLGKKAELTTKMFFYVLD